MTGFVICSFTNSAASASWGPPISPIIITASVSGSCSNRARMSTNELPLIGSPPMPTLVVIPTPSACICDAASYPSVPARHDAHGPARVDVARHDAHHGAARADDTGAVRPDEGGAALLGVPPQVALHPHHVLRGNTIRDGYDQPDAGVRRLHDGVGAERRGDENQARRRARVRDRFLHGVEDRPSQMLAAALPRGDAAHDVRAVPDHLPGVEGALVPGKALDNDARLLVEQDAHAGFVVVATTFSAASESVSAVRIGRPLSMRMRRPSSTLVPASRTTSGTGTRTSRTA